MPIDFTLTPEQQRLRADARTFARDALSKVGSATQDLPTRLARFAATRPFYEQTVAAGSGESAGLPIGLARNPLCTGHVKS